MKYSQSRVSGHPPHHPVKGHSSLFLECTGCLREVSMYTWNNAKHDTEVQTKQQLSC